MTERHEWLEYLNTQRMVRVTNPDNGSAWTGWVQVITDTPGVVLKTTDGNKVNLPQSFDVATVPPATAYRLEYCHHFCPCTGPCEPGCWLDCTKRGRGTRNEPDWDRLGSIVGTQEDGLRMQPVTICGRPSPGGILCSLSPHQPNSEHSWEHREQDAPVPNDGPSMHDLVIRDIASRDPRWDLSVGSARHIRDRVAEDLTERKMIGLERYKSTLQAHNGRDQLRDLYEELMDAACYARARLEEVDESGLEWPMLYEVYESVVTHLVTVRRLRDAATE